MAHAEDPLLKHSRREAVIILVVWAAATAWCCGYSYLHGYDRPGRTLGASDVNPILGIPSWVLWGYLVPWAICGAFTVWFAGFYMADDDLGEDHTADLERKIHEEGGDDA